jgi:hypothetical protein
MNSKGNPANLGIGTAPDLGGASQGKSQKLMAVTTPQDGQLPIDSFLDELNFFSNPSVSLKYRRFRTGQDKMGESFIQGGQLVFARPESFPRDIQMSFPMGHRVVQGWVQGIIHDGHPNLLPIH